jgi:RNA polymerase sigma-70 factor (ECF subfamily)
VAFSAPENLKELVAASSNRDEAAFRELYDTTVDSVFKFVVARVSDREEAVDMIQDIYFDLWIALEDFTFNSDGQFFSFVFTITKRKLSKHYGKQDREPALDHEDLHVTHTDMEARDDERVAKLAVSELPEKYRTVVELRYWSDMSFAEIASVMGLKESAVKVRHFRAIKQLEKIMARYET